MSHQHEDCSSFVVSSYSGFQMNQEKVLVVLISLMLYPDNVATEVSFKPNFVRSNLMFY